MQISLQSVHFSNSITSNSLNTEGLPTLLLLCFLSQELFNYHCRYPSHPWLNLFLVLFYLFLYIVNIIDVAISFSGSLLLAYKNDTGEGVENELTHDTAQNAAQSLEDIMEAPETQKLDLSCDSTP